MLKLFVWDRHGVLKNYGSGIVVIFAKTADEAWTILRERDPRSYFQLRTGHFLFDSQTDYDEADDDERAPRDGFPLEPVETEIVEGLMFLKVGGE